MRDKLKELHRDFVGDTNDNASDTKLLLDLVEYLLLKVEKLENYSHEIR